MIIYNNQINGGLSGSLYELNGNWFRFKLHIVFECLLAGAPLRGKANEKRARDSNTRCEASCATIAMSEIPTEDSCRRTPGRLRRLPSHNPAIGLRQRSG